VLSALLFTHFMVRVLIHPTLMPFICSSRISTFFFSPSLLPTCCSYISFDASCVLCIPHGSRRSFVLPLFLLFSVLYFADKASKLITFLSPSFFFVIYLSENLLGLSVYRAVIVKAILPLFLHPNINSLSTSDFVFPLPFYCSLLSLDCSLAHRS